MELKMIVGDNLKRNPTPWYILAIQRKMLSEMLIKKELSD